LKNVLFLHFPKSLKKQAEKHEAVGSRIKKSSSMLITRVN
jgi:hypothetical protein